MILATFWLFSFERYNGVLGDEPTNNRSIEIQMMNRFLKDNSHLQLLQRHSIGDAPFCKDVIDHILGQFTSTRHLDQYDSSRSSTSENEFIPDKKFVMVCTVNRIPHSIIVMQILLKLVREWTQLVLMDKNLIQISTT